MLKQYKNALWEMIQAAGLDLNDFEGKEESQPTGPPGFVIRYKPANLTFSLFNGDSDPHSFFYYYDIYAPGFTPSPYVESESEYTRYISFRNVREGFEQWLNRQARTAIQEELLPDLWATANETLVPPGEPNTGQFSDEERQQVKLALSTFRVLVIEHFQPDEEQLDAISERLDYLSGAVDRLNKFDWKSVALSTLIGIATTLTLDTERGRQLYGLFQQALSSLMHLLR